MAHEIINVTISESTTDVVEVAASTPTPSVTTVDAGLDHADLLAAIEALDVRLTAVEAVV